MEDFNDWDELKDYAVPGRFDNIDKTDVLQLLEKIFEHGDLAKVIKQEARDEFYEIQYEEEESKRKLKKESLGNPVKIKILESLGFYSFLLNKGFSKTQYEALLSVLFDISDRRIRTILKHDDQNKVTAENVVEKIKKMPNKRI